MSKLKEGNVASGRKRSNVPLHDAVIQAAKTYHEVPLSFREHVQAMADKESFAKLVDAYGADEKPAGNHQRKADHVVQLFSNLKWRIVHRILDEAGYRGRRNTWPLNFYAYEEAIMPNEEKAAQTAEAKDTRKHEYVETPHGEFRKDSVLHIIYKGLARKGGSTKVELAEALTAVHPPSKDDAPWTEKSTINCQIDRMGDERGFKLARTAKGKYGIEPGKALEGKHKGEAMDFSGLTGWDKTRVQTPEQAAKAKAKVDAKAEKDAEKEKAKKAKADEKAKAAAAKEKLETEAKAESAKKQAAEDAKAQAEKAKAAKLK